VFSFGIVLWELLTGEEPYADLHYGVIIGNSSGIGLFQDDLYMYRPQKALQHISYSKQSNFCVTCHP
jgi:hypothetical protein